MISEKEFEDLLDKTESSILDFKEDVYDFKNDKAKVNTAKYIKDVIAFSNTIRTETSYIIFGVKELDNGELELSGISDNIDDAILQDKVKDKVLPRPNFIFFTLKYKSKLFGILEFPVEKYEMPIVPSVNGLRGLEAGKVYYRNGTSNTEASAYDVIRINDWFKSLPKTTESISLNEEVSRYLKQLTKGDEKLSVIISELLSLSKKHNFIELQEFCLNEIKGINSPEPGQSLYRVQKVIVSWHKIEINPYNFRKPTVQLIRKEMEESEGFFETKLMMQHPIIEIESSLEQFLIDPNTYGTMKVDSKALLGTKKKHDLYIYTFPFNFTNLYRNIRQRAIDILMKI